MRNNRPDSASPDDPPCRSAATRAGRPAPLLHRDGGEFDSRARAGTLKSQFDVCRKKLEAAVGEAKEARRAARDALSLKEEVARLEKLLAEAGVEPRKRSPLVSLRMEVVRLRKDLSGAPAPGEAARLLKALKERKETIHALRAERRGLRKEMGR